MNSSSRLILCSILIALFGCSSDSGDDSAAESTDGTEVAAGEGISRVFRTDCGVVMGGGVENPVTSADGVPVNVVEVLDSTHVIIAREAGNQLIKLHALEANPDRIAPAKQLLQQLAAQPAFFFPASEGCVYTSAGGGLGTSGNLFTADGRSYAEELIRAGLAGAISQGGSCGEELVAGCYSALREQHTPKIVGELNDFLWKPRAESAYNHGKLVIHVGPCNTTVLVNGEALPDFGPGNGRCITARSQRTGCAHGRDVKVEVIDNETGLPWGHNGQSVITIPNGCERFEFKF